MAALPAVASEVASSARVAVSLLARVAESPLRGRVSIEALSGHVVASSFGRASAGLALASGVVSSSALASSAARGLGGGVVGHRRRHRRPGGVGTAAARGLGTAPLVRLPELPAATSDASRACAFAARIFPVAIGRGAVLAWTNGRLRRRNEQRYLCAPEARLCNLLIACPLTATGEG